MNVTLAALARAHSNIALVKYWGKVPAPGNLPAVPSLSLTLDAMSTQTLVRFDEALASDRILYNGTEARESEHARIVTLLDRVRAASGCRLAAYVETANDFPTAAGLASSASGFAALALAATRAARLTWAHDKISDLARQSSASAARSLFGGFTTLRAGTEATRFLPAEPLLAPAAWDVALTVAVTTSGPKSIGSSEAMRATAATSPYYEAWVRHAPSLFERARKAVLERDLEALGEVMEASALAMHASMMAARPAILYFQPATLTVLERVRALRAEGVQAYATMDAGPHVKILSMRADAERIARAIEDTRAVVRIITARPGPAAHEEALEPCAPER